MKPLASFSPIIEGKPGTATNPMCQSEEMNTEVCLCEAEALVSLPASWFVKEGKVMWKQQANVSFHTNKEANL